MGTYLNPGNSGFTSIRNDTYIDKSGLIHLINKTIETPRRLTCVSRPRRFGKSFAAQMLCAYYDKSCDSDRLFQNLEIADAEEYREHLNRYDVIYLNMTDILGETTVSDLIAFVKRNIIRELKESYPSFTVVEGFAATLVNAVEAAGNKMIMIIDEWDAPIREIPDIEKDYLKFLRMLFKSSGTTNKIFAAVYMTGILPIKKEGSQSAISDFQEYHMIKPREFGTYVGFTETEVRDLCEKNHIDFHLMKQWYDGYSFRNVGSIYNPNSVMKAIQNKDFDSYWIETSAAENLIEYIGLDFDGLSRTIAELIGGVEVETDPKGFANDLVTFKNRDDVLTLLIHLGYLAYEEEQEKVYIPNEEIRMEFAKTVRSVKKEDTLQRVRESDQLIQDTIHREAEAVAVQIQKIHMEETSPLFYNNEQALRSVVKLAYFSYRDYYIKFEELPLGMGYVDIIYFPKKKSAMPALLIELKWNQDAQGAIDQIRSRKYPEALQEYGGKILLVGIGYDKDSPAEKRRHTCVIEEFVL